MASVVCLAILFALILLMVFQAPGNLRASTSGWDSPIPLEIDRIEDAYYPKIAADAYGNAISVWAQNQSIWANRFVQGIGWMGPERISTNDAETSSALDQEIAMSGSGAAIVVWEEFDGQRFNISSIRFWPGTGWETPETIEVLALSQVYPKVAVDAAGDAMVVWYHYSGMTFDIYSAWHHAETAGWDATGLVETNSTAESTAWAIAMAPDGDTVAAWIMEDTLTRGIWANRYSPATGWGTEQKISQSNPSGIGRPVVAIDAGGNATVIWNQFEYPEDRVWSNRYTGSGWAGPERLDSNDVDQAAQDIGTDGRNITAVWVRYDGIHANITVSKFVEGSAWESPAVVATNDSSVFDGIHVSVNAHGEAIIVWGEYDWVNWTVWVRWSGEQLGWSAAEAIATADINDPEVAISDSGDAFVCWMQFADSRIDVLGTHNPGPEDSAIPEFGGLAFPVIGISAVVLMAGIAAKKRSLS